MTASPLLDVAGRRRSPATLPGYRAGRPPRNKGLRYPADPPRVEEIVAVMRHAGAGIHGDRMRGLVVVLWRAGLRIAEALELAESDLDERRGALLVRHGKGGKRREVGMDDWGWEQLRPWTAQRTALPVGHLFCIIEGPTRGRPWAPGAVRTQLRRVSMQAGVRRRFAPHQLRHAHAVEMALGGRAAERDPTPARAHRPWRHVGLSARHRQRRDHRHDPCPQATDNARRRRPPPLTPNGRHSRAPAHGPADRSVHIHRVRFQWPPRRSRLTGRRATVEGMSSLKFNVVYEDAGEGWVYAHVPELPEVHTQGESLDRAREMVRDAIEMVLEERRERGEAIPQTGWALVEAVEIAA
ncbi:MAG: integrase/recombinase XerD [Gaiellales bacterium]|nr:integrase/recombinase XerD [Gaiellales bacterium]